MSEVKSRPSGPRGRGSGRSGRGGFSSRGGRGGNRQTNGSKTDVIETTSFEEEGEIGELKSKYASKIGPIKEMFPDWTDQDIAFALDETGGDLEGTVERISEGICLCFHSMNPKCALLIKRIGSISQWGEVKKKTKDKTVPKSKDSVLTAPELVASAPNRVGRGRGGSESSRGGRVRGSDRGRGSNRGGRGNHVAATNGTRAPKADIVTTSEPLATEAASTGWDSTTAQTDNMLDSSWEHVTPESVQVAAAEADKTSSKFDSNRSWASMFAKPKPAPTPPKSQPAPPTTEKVAQSPEQPAADPIDLQGLPPPPVNEISEIPNTPPTSDVNTQDVPTITPSADELTETNLEQVPDSSNPPATTTAASTVASTLDPRSVGTPLSKSVARPPMGGYATTAWKAAGTAGRSASFQRKIQEQQEAVVMPGKHAVDRATVQFGSMGLNGTPEDLDFDSDREDAETRAQPPQHSPVAPRASLPPAPQSQQSAAFPPQAQVVEQQTTPRQAPGLPPVNHQDQPLSGEQTNYGYSQFNDRYGSQTQTATGQKPFEPFGQQQPSQQDNYPPTSQPQQSAQSTSGNDTSSFYTTDNQRNTYQNNLYGNYQSQQQESGNPPNRAGSAFGTTAGQPASQYATSHPQGRFNQGEAQASGNSTPNPVPGQQPPNQPPQMPQGQPGSQHGGYGYPYSYGNYYSNYMNHMNQNSHLYGRERPLFDDVRRYDDQYISQNPQYGYGGVFGGGKQGMYGQGHQGYGMSPQASYDQHSGSPANTSAFGSQHPSNREPSSGLGNYGRSGSTQPSENSQQFPGTGATSHNSVSDVFGRSQPGYQGHNQGLGGGNEESLRTYNDKSQSGPSPALGQPGNRPGSAVNAQGQNQGQSGYSGYPNQMNQQMHSQQGSQYGGAPSGFAGHQSGNQNQGYGGYGGGYGGNIYGNNSRGGWGGSYGH